MFQDMVHVYEVEMPVWEVGRVQAANANLTAAEPLRCLGRDRVDIKAYSVPAQASEIGESITPSRTDLKAASGLTAAVS